MILGKTIRAYLASLLIGRGRSSDDPNGESGRGSLPLRLLIKRRRLAVFHARSLPLGAPPLSRRPLRRLAKHATALVFPSLCGRCRRIIREGVFFCDECDGAIRRIADPLCTTCGLPLPETARSSHPCGDCLSAPPDFDWHRSAVIYDDGIDATIHRFKFFSESHLARLLADGLMAPILPLLRGADLLIPVPLAADRLRQRTFNQSLELARALSNATQIPVTVHALRKVRKTAPQTSLPRKERLENLRNAFIWKNGDGPLAGKKIVLVDDVFTTGSTLSACAKVLKKEKAAIVGAVTIAFNVPKQPEYVPASSRNTPQQAALRR